jgi:DNA recombination protein RmuC
MDIILVGVVFLSAAAGAFVMYIVMKQRITLAEKHFGERMRDVELARESFSESMKHLSSTLLEEKRKSLQQDNHAQMSHLLEPLHQRLRDFNEKVERSYNEEKGERIRLKKELEDLMQLNKRLDEDARKLATAISGNNKSQGDWGEMILSRILQNSGLREGEEYLVQWTSTNVQGERIRPDALIQLPHGRHIVIDSKVSLTAYTRLVHEEDDAKMHAFGQEHLASVRGHISKLSSKEYFTAAGIDSPDFVLLFIPVESAFGRAVQLDAELFEYAWDRKIVLVSPSTLLATLRTMAALWTQERRAQNAEEIAREAGALYDKLVSFTDDLLDAGKKMDQAKQCVSDALNKFSLGRGNVLNRVEKMRQLGARNSKQFDANLGDASAE